MGEDPDQGTTLFEAVGMLDEELLLVPVWKVNVQELRSNANKGNNARFIWAYGNRFRAHAQIIVLQNHSNSHTCPRSF